MSANKENACWMSEVASSTGTTIILNGMQRNMPSRRGGSCRNGSSRVLTMARRSVGVHRSSLGRCPARASSFPVAASSCAAFRSGKKFLLQSHRKDLHHAVLATSHIQFLFASNDVIRQPSDTRDE